MARSFDELVAEAAAASVDGWGFSWLEGRATEERPSWGYQRRMSARLATASAALDIQTGGGEVLAEADRLPPVMAATESWAPPPAPPPPARRPPGGGGGAGPRENPPARAATPVG
ncbi:SAM-dependent methyltransferase, partial [Streptomyces smyrnaeus]